MANRQPSETEIAYIAGLIDGEGCIRIKKAQPRRYNSERSCTYYPVVTIGMVERAGIDLIREYFGGSSWVIKPKKSNHRASFHLQLSHRKGVGFLNIIYPYLRVKKEPARIVLSLVELKETSRKHQTNITGSHLGNGLYGSKPRIPHRTYTEEFLQKMDELFERCKAANRGVVYART